MNKQISEWHGRFSAERIFVIKKNKRKGKSILITITTVLIVIYPSTAYAYIDPGITGLLFQTVFAFIFGIVFVWIIRPFKYLIIFIKKIKSLFHLNK